MKLGIARRQQMIKATMREQEAAMEGRVFQGDERQTLENVYLARLRQAKTRLSHVKSTQAKVEIKQELIPEFAEYIDVVLKAGSNRQSDVLVTVLVWSLDVGDYDQMLMLAEFALSRDMVLPGNFVRDLPDFLAEEMATVVFHRDDPESLQSVLQEIYGMVHRHDLHDQVNAKLHKAMGLTLQTSDPRKALWAFKRARELNPKISVKRLIHRIEKNGEF